MFKKVIFFIILIMIIVSGIYLIYSGRRQMVLNNSLINSNSINVNIVKHLEKPNLIKVNNLYENQLINSPLELQGEARGFWFFEASFPIRLLDGNGKEIAVAVAQAQSEWMTGDFVPFLARLEFTAPATDFGTLVFEKDNPSGLPENADELRVSIRFK